MSNLYFSTEQVQNPKHSKIEFFELV